MGSVPGFDQLRGDADAVGGAQLDEASIMKWLIAVRVIVRVALVVG